MISFCSEFSLGVIVCWGLSTRICHSLTCDEVSLRKFIDAANERTLPRANQAFFGGITPGVVLTDVQLTFYFCRQKQHSKLTVTLQREIMTLANIISLLEVEHFQYHADSCLHIWRKKKKERILYLQNKRISLGSLVAFCVFFGLMKRVAIDGCYCPGQV